MNDYIYYYTKDNKYTKTLLGEIQSEFNMSKVIDGTKDSLKISVLSFNGEEIEPMTIIKHENTNTWWVVSHDKVERDTNESGFLYTHNLELLGAIELLNARDLTDCGFDQNTYTIWGYISRLISLSNFEFNAETEWNGYEVQSPTLDINQNVDYIKTFENYTLLSALREFLDGYNCDIKLEFGEEQANWHYGDNEYHISDASFIIVSKTGNNVVHSESVFNDVRETKTIDKNSYGTTVVSNAENVISTKAKTYPSVGASKLMSYSSETDTDNAILKLPSNINKINWIKCYTTARVQITVQKGNDDPTDDVLFLNVMSDKNKNDSFNAIVDNIVEQMGYPITTSIKQQVESALRPDFDRIMNPIVLGHTITLTTGWNYDPVNNGVLPPINASETGFYFPYWWFQYDEQRHLDASLVVCEKQQYDTIHEPTRCLWYEKGKSEIHNFFWLRPVSPNNENEDSYITSFLYTDLRSSLYNNNYKYYEKSLSISVGEGITWNGTIKISLNETPRLILGSTWFKVNYIPMSDLKVKYDNSSIGRDIQLYNQNGKLTDSNAFSKLLLSYSKEIETNNITKYGTYYDYNNIPQVGDNVVIGGVKYVINNVSMDFYQNETNTSETHPQCYEIDCEFTLSRNIAVKSLMTNPNTNIRDYGIPQNNNVVRKQLYRDFYELDYTVASDSDTNWYMPLNKLLNFTNYYREYSDHTAVMKLTYSQIVGKNDEEGYSGEHEWYYQLNSTVYSLKKSLYEIIAIPDNNIIGYDGQSAWSGFDISRVFTGNVIYKNTPIQYTDDNGNVLGFEIAMCNSEQLIDIYDAYQSYEEQLQGTTFNGLLYNSCVFIASEVFEGVSGVFNGAKDNCDFMISEPEYKKDALEVPVFEYSCQIDDTNNIIVGDNIFDSDLEDECYMYAFSLVPKNVCDNNNFKSYATPLTAELDDYNHLLLTLDKTVKLSYVTLSSRPTINIILKMSSYFDTIDRTYHERTQINPQDNLTQYDLLVVRYTINKKYLKLTQVQGGYEVDTKCDLMFVLRNLDQVPSGHISSSVVSFELNHYKIK